MAPWHEPEDRDGNGTTDQHPENGCLQLAGGPGRPLAAGLKAEKQRSRVFTRS